MIFIVNLHLDQPQTGYLSIKSPSISDTCSPFSGQWTPELKPYQDWIFQNKFFFLSHENEYLLQLQLQFNDSISKMIQFSNDGGKLKTVYVFY